jgi:hypothetical protein
MSSPLIGWSVKDWAIRPKMLAIINLVNFQVPPVDGAAPHFCKLLFAAPDRVAFLNLGAASGVGWIISDMTIIRNQSLMVSCLLKIRGGGSIEVHAREQHMFFW